MPKYIALWVAAAISVLGGCGSARHVPGNLLADRSPKSVSGVADPERLTDGRTPIEGDHWQTSLTSVWQPNGSVVFDLGRSTPVNAAAVVGDNNDSFDFAVSEDGQNFTFLWRAGAIDGPGMRLREVSGLGANGRYLRLTVRGGDPSVSVGEVLVFAERATRLSLPRSQADGPHAHVKHALYALGISLSLFLLLLGRSVPLPATFSAGVIVVLVANYCVEQLYALWPLPLDVVSLLRAVIAAVASVAVMCWTLGERRFRLGPIKATLAVLALVGFACFYNFGSPWFRNAAANRPTLVHTYDMRVYFPVAKYFNELRFDGLYLASVKAYLEGEQVRPESIGHVELRDLSNNQLVLVRDVQGQIAQVKERFSETRWHEFVEDMRFFWKTMGPSDYLGSLRDHGGNATPVWLAIAHLMFANADANELNLSLSGLLDPLLLALLFICIGRSFGLRTLLMCAIVFGATDFPMLGSNWWGATLRFDWMVSVGLAACALKSRRFVLAGALLAHAGLARAFPAAALLFTLVPFGLYVLGRILRRERPSPSELRAESAGLTRVLVGAAATSVVLVALSGALFGFGNAWGGWFHKISIHTDKPNTNHVGVRTIFSFDSDNTADKVLQPGVAERWSRWDASQISTYERNAPWVWATRVLFVVLCLLACRGAPLERAAIVGLILIPVLSYPSNYYCHYVFLLPLLAVGLPPLAAMFLEAMLLGMCVLQYPTLSRPVDVRFFWQSVGLIACLLLVLWPLVYQALRDRVTSLVQAQRSELQPTPSYSSALSASMSLSSESRD